MEVIRIQRQPDVKHQPTATLHQPTATVVVATLATVVVVTLATVVVVATLATRERRTRMYTLDKREVIMEIERLLFTMKTLSRVPQLICELL